MQLGFGFGTARYKADRNGPLDQDTIKAGLLALKNGFFHLDAAESWFPYLIVMNL